MAIARRERQFSPSINVLLDGLKRAGIKRKDFVAQTGLSYEYVSRVVNGKVRFPNVRERLEQFAAILQIDPAEFGEYQELLKYSCPSLEMVWRKMRELGWHKSDLAEKVAFSRTYLYEILRGAVEFPRNQRIIEDLAKALNLSPLDFEEYGVEFAEWAERHPEAAEIVFLRLLANTGYHLNLQRSAKALGLTVTEVQNLLKYKQQGPNP